MKKITFLLVLVAISLVGCRQMRQMAALRKCEFRFGKVQNLSLAGVSVQRIQSFSDLKLLDAGKLTAAVASGKLPLSFTLNVEAKNPNGTLAALNAMDWIAFIDNVQLVTGTLAQRVELAPNGGVATIPLAISCDLKEVLRGETKERLLNFGMNLVDAGDSPTRIGLKIKPSVMVGKKAIPYPGYLQVKKEFGAE